MTKVIVAICFLSLHFYVYHFFSTEVVIPERLEFSTFPLEFEGWRCEQPGEIGPEIAANLGATDYLICVFEREADGASIDVYVGYHETQIRRKGGLEAKSSIHPPEHCLPGSGWDIIDSRLVTVDFPGLPAGHGLRATRPEAKRFVIAKGNARRLVYFWYQTQGQVIARNEDVILSRFWSRATRDRTDGSLVRFTIPIVRGDMAAAEATFDEFARQFVPLLEDYVPR